MTLDSRETQSRGSLHRMVGLLIEAWKKRFGEDVSVTMRYVDGSYYLTKPAQWFGETKRFRVGPCAHVDDVLEELTRLHSQPNEKLTHSRD